VLGRGQGPAQEAVGGETERREAVVEKDGRESETEESEDREDERGVAGVARRTSEQAGGEGSGAKARSGWV
jgi:hypothetical protein